MYNNCPPPYNIEHDKVCQEDDIVSDGMPLFPISNTIFQEIQKKSFILNYGTLLAVLPFRSHSYKNMLYNNFEYKEGETSIPRNNYCPDITWLESKLPEFDLLLISINYRICILIKNKNRPRFDQRQTIYIKESIWDFFVNLLTI